MLDTVSSTKDTLIRSAARDWLALPVNIFDRETTGGFDMQVRRDRKISNRRMIDSAFENGTLGYMMSINA